MRSEEAMFGLFMPQNRPKPVGFIDSESGYESDGYDRRHYFTWAIERRDVIRTMDQDESIHVAENPTGEAYGTKFWWGKAYCAAVSEYDVTKTTYGTTTTTTKYEDADATIPYRFVGSYEYGKAVETFEKLVSISTAEELAAYDKVLNGRPEFTYFNGANVMLNAPPNLKNANKNQRTQYFDTFRKKGLAWMMALAKVELSATTSMYGEDKKPFQKYRVTQYDLGPYLQVLADDAAAHLRSLSQERGFHEVTRSGRKIDTWTLAYLRRLKLIRDMLVTISDIGNTEVKARVKAYDKKLAKYEKKLLESVAKQTGSVTTGSTDESNYKTNKYFTLGITSGTLQSCTEIVQAYENQ